MAFKNYYSLIFSFLFVLFISNDPVYAQIAESWSLSGDVSVTAANTDTTVSIQPAFGFLMNLPTISDGARGSISAASVGATASSSYTHAAGVDASVDDIVVGTVTITASNVDSAVTTTGSINGGLIEGGHDNAITGTASGASAQLSVNDYVSSSATLTDSLTINGEIGLDSENSGAVTLQTDFGADGSGPQISGGTRNSISGIAVGSSAGISVSTTVDDGTYESNIAIGTGSPITVTAINSGDVTIGYTDDPTQPAMLSGATITSDSVNSSVSLMAVGASGFVTSSTVVYSGTASPSVSFGDVSFDVQNTGRVQANVSISDMSLDGSNSISAGAVGSSVSFSANTTTYGDGAINYTGTIGSVSFASANSGAILSTGGLFATTIVRGYNVASALTAVGSTASLPFTS